MSKPSVTFPLPPGSTIGILGSGQLGRMLAMASARLGLKCHIYADAPGPAFDVAASTTVAAYDDAGALAIFAKAVAVATYEFENIPVATVTALAAQITVRPGIKALACAQDRLNEKRLARTLGATTAEFAAIDSLARLTAHLTEMGVPAILKTRRFGYDGKGQVRITHLSEAAAAWARMGGHAAILESVVPFEREVSVVAARTADGAFAAYDVSENEHQHHILHTATVPARLTAAQATAAIAATRAIADELEYVGVLAVEFFVLGAAHDNFLVVNEIAPRVHNSGHWTTDACLTSQFENHIRAVAGWPLGSTERHANAVMTNLIGHDHDAWVSLAAEPGCAVHLYGKREARPGRKMGHVTRLAPKTPAKVR